MAETPESTEAGIAPADVEAEASAVDDATEEATEQVREAEIGETGEKA